MHTFLSGAGASRPLAGVEPGIRINPEYHQNFILMNFDTFDQATDDLAFRDEIDRTQSVMDSSGKLFETINDEKQLAVDPPDDAVSPESADQAVPDGSSSFASLDQSPFCRSYLRHNYR